MQLPDRLRLNFSFLDSLQKLLELLLRVAPSVYNLGHAVHTILPTLPFHRLWSDLGFLLHGEAEHS